MASKITLQETRPLGSMAIPPDVRGQSLGPICGSHQWPGLTMTFLWFCPKCTLILHVQSWPHWAGTALGFCVCHMGLAGLEGRR